jgi:ABC-2 type transport system permease protein
LAFRDRQAIFWSYLFPLFFLFLFCSVFARGRAEMVINLLPGLLCISAMSAGFFGMSIVLVMMRERGLLRRYNLAPIGPWMIISSQMVSSLVISLSALLLQIALAKILYKIEIADGIAAMLVMLTAGSLAFLALGFIIASVAENVKTAQLMANLLFFPLMFLGGAAFPLQFLPSKLQNLSRLLPSNYLVDGLYRVMKEGAGLGANVKNLGVLILSIAVSLLIAAKLFRWDSREPMPPRQKAWVAAVALVFVVAGLVLRR